MKKVVIKENHLIHNINEIQRLANLNTTKESEEKYKIIGVVKGNRLWTSA